MNSTPIHHAGGGRAHRSKDFDLLFIPGAGHSSVGQYGTRGRNEFFVEHLLGVTPTDWNREATAETDGPQEERATVLTE